MNFLDYDFSANYFSIQRGNQRPKTPIIIKLDVDEHIGSFFQMDVLCTSEGLWHRVWDRKAPDHYEVAIPSFIFFSSLQMVFGFYLNFGLSCCNVSLRECRLR